MSIKKIKYIFNILSFSIVLVFTYSCNKIEKLDFEEYTEWAADPENGLVIEKTLNGLKVTVSFIPPAIVAYQQIISDKINMNSFDSILKQTSYNLQFRLKIEAIDNKEGSLLFYDVTNEQEYIERINTLNFEIRERINLIADTVVYPVVLASCDNAHGLKKDLSFLFVFSPQSKKEELMVSKKLDFVFTDLDFGLGILHFKFNENIQKNLPQLITSN